MALGILATLGMGAGIFSQLAKSDPSSGFSPQFKINLSPEGAKLEKQLFKSIKKDVYPESLAHRHLGAAKKVAQARQRQTTELMKGLSARKRLGALGAEGVMRMRESTSPFAEVAQSRMSWQKQKWQNMYDFMNMQRQTPIMAAQGQMYNEKLRRMAGARKGAALGGLAQLAAISAFPVR